MKLATWNLWWRFGDCEDRGRAIRTTLQQLDADVVGLQEVWHTDTTSFAQVLADELGYHCAFVASPAPQKWQRRLADDTFGVGNAILSRWPIDETASVRLPAGDKPDEGRVALNSLVATPHGTLPFTCTHLNSGWGHSSIRSDQLRAVGQLMSGRPTGDFPPVLCGDFNAMPDFDEIRALSGKRDPLVPDLVLLDAWPYVRHADPGYTWDQANPAVAATHEPSARIDYIFVGLPSGHGLGKPLTADIFGNQPVDGTWPSDHYGVVVETRHRLD